MAFIEGECLWHPALDEHGTWQSLLDVYGLLGGAAAVPLLRQYADYRYVQQEFARRYPGGDPPYIKRFHAVSDETEAQRRKWDYVTTVCNGANYGLVHCGVETVVQAVLDDYRAAVLDFCAAGGFGPDSWTVEVPENPAYRRYSTIYGAGLDWYSYTLSGWEEHLLKRANGVPFVSARISLSAGFPELVEACPEFASR
jgi:hypothetical protein